MSNVGKLESGPRVDPPRAVRIYSQTLEKDVRILLKRWRDFVSGNFVIAMQMLVNAGRFSHKELDMSRALVVYGRETSRQSAGSSAFEHVLNLKYVTEYMIKTAGLMLREAERSERKAGIGQTINRLGDCSSRLLEVLQKLQEIQDSTSNELPFIEIKDEEIEACFQLRENLNRRAVEASSVRDISPEGRKSLLLIVKEAIDFSNEVEALLESILKDGPPDFFPPWAHIKRKEHPSEKIMAGLLELEQNHQRISI